MELEIPEFFLDELAALPSPVQSAVFDKLEKLQEEGLSIQEVELASRADIDIKAYRLKVKPADDVSIDHRVIFDVIDSTAYLVAVDHRDNIYETKKWAEIKDRLQQ